MLRIVSPDRDVITAPITYRTAPAKKTPSQVERAAAAALISVADVSDEPGKTIFVQTGQLSSGSTALAYSLNHGQLVPAGVVLRYGGDSATKAGFQCVGANPPRIVAHSYDLTRGIKIIHGKIYGWWNEVTTTYVWRGIRLVKLAQRTLKRRVLPSDSVGDGCIKGIA
jgi:hypothetical protein